MLTMFEAAEIYMTFLHAVNIILAPVKYSSLMKIFENDMFFRSELKHIKECQ
jgi:hypothetical protein